MVHTRNRERAEQEDRVGRKMRHTSKKGLKKAIWNDSRSWSNEDLTEEREGGK